MARRIYHRKSRDEGRKRWRFRRPKESWTAGARGLPAVRLGGGLRVEYGTTAGQMHGFPSKKRGRDRMIHHTGQAARLENNCRACVDILFCVCVMCLYSS